MKTHLCSHRFTQGPLALALAGSMALALAQPATSGPGLGPNPQLPAPEKSGLVPTFNIAPAQGWPQGAQPQAPAGFKVTALARGLDHPRWVYTLPNGDVLVAESNKPPPAEGAKNVHSDGLRGLAMGLVMKRAGAGTPSANRITLLRDTDGDGRTDDKEVAGNTDGCTPIAILEDRLDKLIYEETDLKIDGAHTLKAAYDSNSLEIHTSRIPKEIHKEFNNTEIEVLASFLNRASEIVKDTMVGGATLTALIGTSAWYAPGAAGAALVESIVRDEKKLFTCCVSLNGEYGQNDICLGVPVVIGKNGWEKIVEMDLSTDEQAAFNKSADAVRNMNDVLKTL